MNTYKFYEDRPVIMWTRDTYSVEANSYEEAEALLKNAIINGDEINYHDEFEYQYDTVRDEHQIESEWINEEGEEVFTEEVTESTDFLR